MKEGKGAIRFGISLRDNNLKIVEVENSSSQQFRINKIVQTTIDSSLNLETIGNDDQMIEIGHQIRDVFSVFDIDSKNAIFTLESPFALIKKIPIDSKIEDDELINQIDWEVKQFSYSPDDEYIVDFQKLETGEKSPIREMVVVSVRERVIQQLRKIFASGKISVNVIDLDVFSALRAIEVNYDLKQDEIISLIDIDKKLLKFTIIKDKEFYNYYELPILELKKEISTSEDTDYVGLISKELRKIVVDLNLGDNLEQLHRIFLYGNQVKDSILENLQNNYNVRIDKINPFRKLYIAPKVSVDEKIWSHPETFTVCVGSALR